MPDQGCDNSRSSHSLSLAVQYLLVYRLILSPCILTTVLAGLSVFFRFSFKFEARNAVIFGQNCKKMKRATRHFPCSSQRSVVSLSESRGGLKFHGVIMRRSIRNINIPPPGKPRAFELLKIELFKFPPPWAKIAFKYPTLALDLTVKCPS